MNCLRLSVFKKSGNRRANCEVGLEMGWLTTDKMFRNIGRSLN